jgi:hypothetical protein
VATPSKPAAKRTTGTATQPTTTAAKRTTGTATQPAAIAQVSLEQLGSVILQGQQLRVDATQTWVDAFMGDVQAATKLTFDVAADLLSAQREFAVELTKVLLPAKRA